MSDFVIKRNDGKELLADDVVVNPDATVVKYIEADSHTRRLIKMAQVKEISKERRGWEGGSKFRDSEVPSGWCRSA